MKAPGMQNRGVAKAKRKCLSVVLTALAVLLFCPTAAQAAPAGQVFQVQGQVRVENPPQNRDLEAHAGLELVLKDKVITKKESSAKLVLADKSLVRMGPESTFVIDQMTFDPGQGVRDVKGLLPTGKVRVFINDLFKFKKRRFQIQTPTAVAGVRGTRLLIIVLSPDATLVLGYDFPVEVYNVVIPERVVVLAKGTFTIVRRNQPPTDPRLPTEEERQRFERMLPQMAEPRLGKGAPLAHREEQPRPDSGWIFNRRFPPTSKETPTHYGPEPEVPGGQPPPGEGSVQTGGPDDAQAGEEGSSQPGGQPPGKQPPGGQPGQQPAPVPEQPPEGQAAPAQAQQPAGQPGQAPPKIPSFKAFKLLTRTPGTT
ncbi:MAG: FecR family protein, partial [Desulfarculaceae bacterium]